MKGVHDLSDPKKKRHSFSVEDVLAEAQSKRNAKKQTAVQAPVNPPQPQKPAAPETPMPAAPQPMPEIQTPPAREMPMPQPPAAQPGQVRFAAQAPAEKPEPEKKKGRRREKKARDTFEETEDIYYGLHLKSAEELRNTKEAAAPNSQKSAFSYLFEETAAPPAQQAITPPVQQSAAPAQPVAPASRPAAPARPAVAPAPAVPAQPPADPAKAERIAAAIAAEKHTGRHPAKKAAPKIVKSTVEDLPPAPKAPMPEKPPLPPKHEEPIVRYLEEDPEKQRRSVTSPRIPKNISAKAQAKPVHGGNTVELVLKTIENEVDEKIPAIYHQPQTSALHKAEAQKSDEAKETKPQTAEKSKGPSSENEKPDEKKAKTSDTETGSPKGKTQHPRKPQHHPEPPEAQEVLTDPNGKILYASRNKPVHFMDTNWLHEALLSEAKEYLAAPTPSHAEVVRRAEGPSMPVYSDEPLPDEPDEAFMDDEEPAYEPEIHEYETPQDADMVSRQLEMQMHENKLRTLVTGGCTLILLLAGFLSEYTHIGSLKLHLSSGPIPYLISNLVFLLLATAFNLKSILHGFRGLFRLRANPDSGIAVATTAAVIQSIAAFFFQESVMSGTLHLYSSLAAVALLLNGLGKSVMLRRIDRNFQFVSSPEQKYAVETLSGNAEAAKIAADYAGSDPVVAYQHHTEFPEEFIRLSHLPDPGNSVSQMITPVGFLASLILFAASLLMFGSFPEAITAFTVSACICVPAANLLCVNLPLNRLSSIASKWGGMISGYAAIEEFSKATAVMVDADDLFPKGTVELNNIKTFGTPHVDEAILEAAALVNAVGGPLGDVFEQVLKAKKNLIPKIEKIAYEDGLGVSGWSRGKRVLLGSRELLANHGVPLPPRDVETRYLQAGKQVTYLATGGVAAAMFVLTYHADTRRAAELLRMEHNGIAVMIRTCDHNITPGLIAACFEVDGRMIRILPSSLSGICEKAMDTSTPRSPAVMLTKGRPMTMMRLLAASVRQKSNITISVLLQIIAVVLGFVLVAFMTCYSGLYQMRTLSLLLYEVFWAAVIAIIPLIRKP